MTNLDLKTLAKVGAMAKLADLGKQRSDILRMFPELQESEPPTERSAPHSTPRRGMTAANRKAISERMKHYWAERRKKEKK